MVSAAPTRRIWSIRPGHLYEDFTEVVINGRENVTTSQQSVMPAFGKVMDVATYIDDIYAYLQARADGALGRGRPQRQQ